MTVVKSSAVVFGVLLLSGCGGNKPGTKQPQPARMPPATSTAPATARDVKVTMEVRVVRDGQPRDYRHSTRAKIGDIVQILAREAPGNSPAGVMPRVTLTIPMTSSQRIVVRVASAGAVGQAQIRASDSRPIKLTGLRYTCRIGSESFCPVETHRAGGATELSLAAKPKGTLAVFVADVAPG